MSEFKERFIAEALELLSKLEKNLLLLEEKLGSSIVEAIFRDLHTLKGSSGMYGFDKIGQLMHLIENVFDSIRNGELLVNTDIINLSLNVVDFTGKVLKLKEDVSDSKISEYKEIKQQIAIYQKQTTRTIIEEDTAPTNKDKNTEKTFYITFTIDGKFETRGIKLDSIFKELKELGSIISIPIKNKKKSSTQWEVFIVSKSLLIDIEDVFIFMLDIVKIEHLVNKNMFLNDEFNSIVQKNAVLKKKNSLKKLKSIIEKSGNESNQKNPNFIPKEEIIKQSTINTTNYLRVSADKLDEQMDLLSELVTAKAELRLIVEKEGYKKLTKLIESVDKITERFRKNILKVRLIQIKTLYVMFLRLVRDISKRLNKEVEFIAEGLETELDKNIIDSLESPLTHLIRNSLDHGIETAAERKKTGKNEKGTISFITYRSGTDILIEIRDDGRGMDKKKIRQKAIDKRLITEETELSDKQLFDLIFTPGFSTAQNLSEVSGRGVGMDVVKKSINLLRGNIEIESEENKGTTVRIRLPISLSIIDTLLVQSGKQFFAIPLLNIRKCTQLDKEELEQSDNNQLTIEEKLIPFIHLRNIFRINGEIPKSQRVVIVSNNVKEVGLVVDKVIGEYQAVLKPFDGYLINQQYFTGASLLADGQLTVILDTNKLIESYKKPKQL